MQINSGEHIDVWSRSLKDERSNEIKMTNKMNIRWRHSEEVRENGKLKKIHLNRMP